MVLLIYRDALRFKKMHDRNVQEKEELEQVKKEHPELVSEEITNRPEDWTAMPAETNSPVPAISGASTEE